MASLVLDKVHFAVRPPPKDMPVATFFLLSLPGFLVSFLIGSLLRNLWRPENRPSFQKIALCSAPLGPISAYLFLTLFFWALDRVTVVDHFSQPVTFQQALDLHSPLGWAPEAKNIRFGTAGGGGLPGSYEYLLRYEVPPEVVHTLLQRPRDQWTPITTRLAPLSGSMFPKTSWFDIENIDHGVISINPEDSRNATWIDTDRNVIYSRHCGGG